MLSAVVRHLASASAHSVIKAARLVGCIQTATLYQAPKSTCSFFTSSLAAMVWHCVPAAWILNILFTTYVAAKFTTLDLPCSQLLGWGVTSCLRSWAKCTPMNSLRISASSMASSWTMWCVSN